jgi:hypothetical protein
MNKIIATIALATLSAAATASDTNVTTFVDHSIHGKDNSVRVVTGKQFGAFTGELQASRDLRGDNRVTNFGANVGYPVGTFAGVAVTPYAGVNYLTRQRGVSGYGVRAGVTGSVALTKRVSLVADAGYLRNEGALRKLDGGSLGLGLSFGL